MQRPAAIAQLQTLCQTINVPVFIGEVNPVTVAEQALKKAKSEGFDVLIVDTAGRLHVDQELMDQLAAIKKALDPQEIPFVANSTTGQDAVTTAVEFAKHVSITGTILTMLDGSSRAGAAISIREVTQKPLKFEGVGERIADLQPFNPQSMADRILGMGDVVNLVRKAKEEFDDKQTQKLEEKSRKPLLPTTTTYNRWLPLKEWVP